MDADKRRTYTTDEIDKGLLALIFNGNNSGIAVKALRTTGLKVNDRTLRQWKVKHRERLDELALKHAPAIENHLKASGRAIAMASQAGTMEAIEAARKQLRDGDARDPAAMARNLATVTGIATDKVLLLDGRPTEIVSNDVAGLMERMARALGHTAPPRAIESTTVEDAEVVE